QDVDRLPRALDRREHICDLRGLCYVTGIGVGFAALCRYRLGRAARGLFVDVERADVGALPGKQHRNCLADARPASCDNGAFPTQVEQRFNALNYYTLTVKSTVSAGS